MAITIRPGNWALLAGFGKFPRNIPNPSHPATLYYRELVLPIRWGLSWHRDFTFRRPDAPNAGHGLPLGREPTGAGPILRHLGPRGRSGEIVNLIEIV